MPMGLLKKSKQKDTVMNEAGTSLGCEFPFQRRYLHMAPRCVPSSAGLPEIWTPAMDAFICYSNAVGGDIPMKFMILSLKKRFPVLGPYTVSESAIERRVYCLDRMGNDYFKKGAALAVQRLESIGLLLPPPPEWDMNKENPLLNEHQKKFPPEPVTPTRSSTVPAGASRIVNQASVESKGSSTARYVHEHYAKSPVKNVPTAYEGRTSPKAPQPTFEAPARFDSTIHAAWHEDVRARTRASLVKVGSSNSRPSNETGRRPKDVNPMASFDHLNISEDPNQPEGTGSYTSRSASNASASRAKDSYGAKSGGPSLASSVNPSLGFSSGSPRQPHSRIRPVASNTRMPAGPYPTDENKPLKMYTPTRSERRQHDLPLRVYTPTNPTTASDSTDSFSALSERRYG